jgi:predicted PurR-regulated permease PerM
LTLQRKLGFWFLIAIAFVAFVFVLRDVLLPFVAGLALAYLLNPLIRRLEAIGLSRLLATLLILILFLAAFVAVLILALPLIGSQLVLLVERLPGVIARLQQLIAEQSGPLLDRFGGQSVLADLQRSLGDVLKQAAAWIATVLGSLWSGGQAVLGVFSLLVLTPIIAFYLMLDWEKMIAAIDGWLPRDQRETIRQLLREMDQAISGFLRGQTLVCLILGLFYATALGFMGLNFGVLIGLTAGFLSFIPYVGSLTGLVLSVGMAIAQFWPEWTMVLLTLGIFALGQFVEGNVLSPKLVGEAVGLHPVWLMFALLAFGSLFGFVGLLLAVPLAAAVGVLARFGLQQYLDSPFHKGLGVATAEAGAARGQTGPAVPPAVGP